MLSHRVPIGALQSNVMPNSDLQAAVRTCRKRADRLGVYIEDAGDQELLLLSDVTGDLDYVHPQALRSDATVRDSPPPPPIFWLF